MSPLVVCCTQRLPYSWLTLAANAAWPERLLNDENASARSTCGLWPSACFIVPPEPETSARTAVLRGAFPPLDGLPPLDSPRDELMFGTVSLFLHPTGHGASAVGER